MAEAPKRRLQRPTILVCDIQDKFRNAIWEFDKVVRTTSKVLKAAALLSIPVHNTTQNAARLGQTVTELAPLLDSLSSRNLLLTKADKTLFSMWIPELSAQVGPPSPPADIAIVGIEAHICVTQTALDALAAGHRVYVLADGVSSCNREEVPVALDRLRQAGATVTTSESWLYEVIGDAGIPEFRSIVGLVKETSADTKAALGALVPSKM